MKNIYTTIFASAIALFASGAIHNVSITSNLFTPNNFTANVGDQVVWTLNAGIHTTTSLLVPVGAATWDSGTLSIIGGTFTYNITTSGTYGYWCNFNGATGMGGGFVVNPVGISNPSIEPGALFFPSPFMDKITVSYKDIDNIIVYDMLGKIVKKALCDVSASKTEMDMSTLPKGVYFFRTMKEGEIISTRKIVKS